MCVDGFDESNGLFGVMSATISHIAAFNNIYKTQRALVPTCHRFNKLLQRTKTNMNLIVRAFVFMMLLFTLTAMICQIYNPVAVWILQNACHRLNHPTTLNFQRTIYGGGNVDAFASVCVVMALNMKWCT